MVKTNAKSKKPKICAKPIERMETNNETEAGIRKKTAVKPTRAARHAFRGRILIHKNKVPSYASFDMKNWTNAPEVTLEMCCRDKSLLEGMKSYETPDEIVIVYSGPVDFVALTSIVRRSPRQNMMSNLIMYRLVSCQICNKVFNSVLGLNRHIDAGVCVNLYEKLTAKLKDLVFVLIQACRVERFEVSEFWSEFLSSSNIGVTVRHILAGSQPKPWRTTNYYRALDYMIGRRLTTLDENWILLKGNQLFDVLFENGPNESFMEYIEERLNADDFARIEFKFTNEPENINNEKKVKIYLMTNKERDDEPEDDESKAVYGYGGLTNANGLSRCLAPNLYPENLYAALHEFIFSGGYYAAVVMEIGYGNWEDEE